MVKQRKWFKRTALATALLAFLAGGIKTGAEEIKLERKTPPFSLESTITKSCRRLQCWIWGVVKIDLREVIH